MQKNRIETATLSVQNNNVRELPNQVRAQGKRIYTVGTLRYTTTGLVVLFCWLLWGDFCFSFFESIFGRFMPLYLNKLEASNTVISLLTGSIAGTMNILFLPHISMSCDRYRSRWGRRIPFLAWSTPCTVLSLIVIGWAPEITAFLQTVVGPLRAISSVSLTLLLLGIFTVSWHFFNMVLVNVFRFLLKDVVPEEVMPRMLAYFQVVGTAANIFFSWYVFPHVLEERKLICTGVGILYLVVFTMMCWRVKEGNYPPPAPQEKGYFNNLLIYFRECLSIRIYRNVIIIAGLMNLSATCNGFAMLFATNQLELSQDLMGKVFAWVAVLSMFAYFPLAYLCRKLNPLKLGLISLLLVLAGNILSFWLITNERSWIISSLVMVIPVCAWGLAVNTMQMELFPVAKFGQFFSSTNAIGFGCAALGSLIVGRFMDMTHSNFRMHFLVIILCHAAAIPALIFIYRDWKRFGGPSSYRAPMPANNTI